MRAELTTLVPVNRFAVFAEMAWLEHRPELGLLCGAAQEQDGRISPATVQDALPGLTDAGAVNVMRWCEMLGLCDESGGLTELGKQVAETGDAPVPEQGTYDVWAARHPLFGQRILHLERLAPTADGRFENIVALPMVPDKNVVFGSVVRPAERFIFRKLPSNQSAPAGLVHRDPQPDCNISWTLDFEEPSNWWQLDGIIADAGSTGENVSMQHKIERANIDLAEVEADWGVRLLSQMGRWSPHQRRLSLAFDGLTPEEQDSFFTMLDLDDVQVPGHGEFDLAVLHDVPIGPDSAEDAQLWALARFNRHLEGPLTYRSRGSVRADFIDLVEDTPLEPFAPTLPGHEDYLAGELHTKQPSVFWGLAAPVDLAPTPVTEQDLMHLKVGSADAEEPEDRLDLVRVPYRGRWSMRRFVQSLLVGGAPRHVLFCDRYVRGDGNMVMLQLLVDALREVAPDCRVTVWTENREADFLQIQRITGSRVGAYRERFSQERPHDRYLLMQMASGDAVGWQMTNSPLQARADQEGADAGTPLRWRDLVAARAEAHELAPALRQWMTGGER